MSEWSVITWILAGAAGLLGLYSLHRLALWLEREGWIRYWKNPPRAEGGGALLGELQKIYEPQTRHVFEMKEKARPLKEDESGEDPSRDGKNSPPG
jgi:hypothetical protein